MIGCQDLIYNNMTTITKDQFQAMLNKSPQGIPPEEIAKSLIRQGYKLEGLDINPQDLQTRSGVVGETLSRPQIGAGEAPAKSPGFFRRLIQPAVGFGQSIAGAIQGSPNRQLQQATESLFSQQTDILNRIQEARNTGADTTQLMQALKLNQESIAAIPGAEELNPALAKTTKQISAEAAGTFGLVTLGGALGGAGLTATQGLRITGALSGASFAASESLANDEAVTEVFKEAIKGGLWGLAAAELGIQVTKRIPKLLSIFTGESDRAVKAAMSNPQVADKALQNGDEVLRATVQEAGERAVQLKNQFIQGHRQAFQEIAGDVLGNKVKKQGLISAMKTKLQAAGIKIKDGVLDFTTSKLQANPGEATRIKQAWTAINQWEDWTVAGVHKYKQLVGELTGFFDEGGKAAKSQFLRSFYGDVANTVRDQIPEASRAAYDAMNQKFSQNIGLYDDMVTAFNSGDPFQRIAGLFGKNKDALRQTVNFFESQAGQTVSPVVGARELSMHKQAALGFLSPRSWIDFFLEPATQAKAVTLTGRAQQRIQQATDLLRTPVR